MNGWKRFLSFALHRHRLGALGACLIGVLSGLFAAGLYGVSSFILSLAALHPTFDVLMVPAVVVRFLGLGRAVLAYLDRLCAHNETFQILADIRLYVYDCMTRLLPSEADRGAALSAVVSDVETLQDGLLRVVYPIAVALATAIFGTVAAALFSPVLAVVFFILAVPFPFVLFGFLIYKANGHQAKAFELRQALYGQVVETLSGLRDIAANNLEAHRMASLNQLLAESGAAQREVSRLLAVSEASAGLYNGVCLVVLLGTTAYLGISGRMSGVLVAAALIALTYLTESISGLSTISSRTEQVGRASANIFTQQSMSHGHQQEAAPVMTNPTFKVLQVENLSFSYPGRQLLTQLSFSASPGKPVVLCGRSGSGKSTLVDLVLGLRRPERGSVTADMTDLSMLPESERLALFSVVEQTPHFFNESLRANLLAGDKTDEELLEALNAVGLNTFVKKLEQGLDTLVFESGDNFSGGELQRLSMARALLRDASFYIFDEPTASLDTKNEQLIFELIAKLSAEKAVLLITHRFSGGLPGTDVIVL